MLLCTTWLAFIGVVAWLVSVYIFCSVARAEMVSIVIASNAAPRVEFGAEKLVEALQAVKLTAVIVHSDAVASPKIWINPPHNLPIGHEGFQIGQVGGAGALLERARERRLPVTPGG